MEFFNENPNADSFGKVRGQLNDVKDVMVKNIGTCSSLCSTRLCSAVLTSVTLVYQPTPSFALPACLPIFTPLRSLPTLPFCLHLCRERAAARREDRTAGGQDGGALAVRQALPDAVKVVEAGHVSGPPKTACRKLNGVPSHLPACSQSRHHPYHRISLVPARCRSATTARCPASLTPLSDRPPLSCLTSHPLPAGGGRT